MVRKIAMTTAKEDHRSPEAYEEQKSIDAEVARRIKERYSDSTEVVAIDPPEKFQITDPFELDLWKRGIESRARMAEWRAIELVYLARYVRLSSHLIEAELEALTTPFTFESMTQFGSNTKVHPIHSVYTKLLAQYMTLGKYLGFHVVVQDEVAMRDEIYQQVLRDRKGGGVIEGAAEDSPEGLLAS